MSRNTQDSLLRCQVSCQWQIRAWAVLLPALCCAELPLCLHSLLPIWALLCGVGMLARWQSSFMVWLQVMGAPLAGSPVRATVTGGGGLRLKGLQPVWRSRRLYMLFPLKGTERRGIVSLEAKKRQVGHCLAAGKDVPPCAGGTGGCSHKGLQVGPPICVPGLHLQVG